MMVANLYVIKNRVGSKSFLWHKQLNYDITTFSQIWINTYVNLRKVESAPTCFKMESTH